VLERAKRGENGEEGRDEKGKMRKKSGGEREYDIERAEKKGKIEGREEGRKGKREG
jgi:hypothetical protein